MDERTDTSYRRLLTVSALASLVVAATGIAVPHVAAQDAPSEESSPAKKISKSAPEITETRLRKLRSAIAKKLGEGRLAESRVGIYAVDLETGTELVAHNADGAFNPASNVKLVTAAAALDRFGPDHTFSTELRARSKPNEKGVVEGALYFRGEGEGFLLYEDLVGWAARLRRSGVSKIEGGIVVDDYAFDEAYIPPGYDQKKEDASYRAPIGAVSVNLNAVSVRVEPTREGAPPKVVISPPNDHVEIVNRAKTVDGRVARIGVRSTKSGDGTRITVTGTTGTGARTVVSRKRIDNPPLYAGAILENALEIVGIEVEGKVRRGETPEGTKVLVRHRSDSLSYLIAVMNKHSKNFIAEQLLRTMGLGEEQPSTWEASFEAVRTFLEGTGIDTEGLTYANGSGLYLGNQLSPRQIVGLLRYMREHTAGPEFESSLAIAGRDGTLSGRFEEGPAHGKMRAKTGTLNRVSALSGYLETASGHDVAFSILLNDTPRFGWLMRGDHDELAQILAGF